MYGSLSLSVRADDVAISGPERRDPVPDSRFPFHGQNLRRGRQKRAQNGIGMRLRVIAAEDHLQS